MKGIVEGETMNKKEILYLVMDLMTVFFNVWLLGYIISRFDYMHWNIQTVVLVITGTWTIYRLVQIYWYVCKTIHNIKKGINR